MRETTHDNDHPPPASVAVPTRLRAPLLKWRHFAPYRDGTERGQQENNRARANTIEAGGKLTAIVAPEVERV